MSSSIPPNTSAAYPAAGVNGAAAAVRPLATPALSATALLQVLRHRWLTAACLAAGAALTAATAVWLAIPKPKNTYSATALVHIAPHPRQNDMYSYQVFQRTQVELCKRRSVLESQWTIAPPQPGSISPPVGCIAARTGGY